MVTTRTGVDSRTVVRVTTQHPALFQHSLLQKGFHTGHSDEYVYQGMERFELRDSVQQNVGRVKPTLEPALYISLGFFNYWRKDLTFITYYTSR